MLYLYSGFSDDFNQDIKSFVYTDTGVVENVALLLQGGPGYENYLDDYIEPIKSIGIDKIDIIVPNMNDNIISKNDIAIIKNADSIFIGGGYTPRYAELYGVDEIKTILMDKYMKRKNIGGVSAGSIIMNDFFRSEGKVVKGLGLVKNMYIYPHFEEEQNGYEMIKDAMENEHNCYYGIETNAYFEIDYDGIPRKKGKGRIFKIFSTGKGKAEINEILP